MYLAGSEDRILRGLLGAKLSESALTNWTTRSEKGRATPYIEDVEYVVRRGGLICILRVSALVVDSVVSLEPVLLSRGAMSIRTGIWLVTPDDV